MDAKIAGLLVDGKKAYEQKQYEEAIQLYTIALHLERGNEPKPSRILPILDLRISAYIKAAKCDLAQDDAKSMVRLNRADGRGYLRCGQIERLREDYSAALRWYDHGFKNVPAPDRLHEYIRVQRKKTEDMAFSKLTLSKPADPATTLPAEVFQMVVSYLKYREIVAVLRVSKKWTRLLSNLQPVTDTLDFTDAHKVLGYQMLRASLQRLSKWPKTILAAKLNEPAAKYLASHLERWVNHRTLQHLEVTIASTSFTQLPFHRYGLHTIGFGIECAIDMKNVLNVLRSCKQLRSASFANIFAPSFAHYDSVEDWNCPCPRMEVFDVRVGGFTNVIPIPLAVFQYFPNLIRLTCRNFHIGNLPVGVQIAGVQWDLSHMESLRYLDLSQSNAPYSILLPRSLEAWNSTGTHFITENPRPLPQELPNLRMITVDGCNHVPSVLWSVGLTETGNLLNDLTLNMDGRDLQVFFTLLEQGRRFTKLKSLFLTCQQLKDEHLNQFSSNMPVIERLSLRNAAVSGVFLVGLITTVSSRLSSIHLNNCSRVSHDAVEWARKRGIVVELSNGERLPPGSQRIREFDWIQAA